MLRLLMIAAILAPTLVLSLAVAAPPQSSKRTAGMPDVLVLVLSGMGPVDQVSINYSTTVPADAVKADISALAKETAWIVGGEKVSTKTVAAGGGRKTTSGSFTTLATVNYREGFLPLSPFINALKRFRTIEVDYLVPERFRFQGLKDFENEFVKIHLEQRGGSYLYRVCVKDSGFDRLLLPVRQPKPQPKQTGGLSGSGRAAWIAVFALLCALAAYFGVRAMYRGRAL
jgi:hypothetical protein